MKEAYLALDFGGGSGRVLAGWIDDGKVQFEEIHRFRNRQVRIGKHLYWDFPSLFQDMKEGLSKAAQRHDMHIVSIGVDTWGVDFGFIDKRGNLLSLPVCYRDERTNGLCQQFCETHSATRHYATAGIQMMDINSIYQLIAMQKEHSPMLDVADKLLFMPDLFSYYLTGVANCEYTIASTSELLDAKLRNWNWELIDTLGLRREMFPPIIMPGTVRGNLLPQIAEETGLSTDVKVVAVASHDTQSASYVVPKDCAFISSGTWSLLGVTLDEPILTEEARLAGCSNEGAVAGKINFLQNITGLWFLQRLIEEWKSEGLNTDFKVMLPQAEEARISTVLDVDDPMFASPRSMSKAIATYCQNHNLQAPQGIGEHVRVVFQSLAQRYAKGIKDFNRFLPHPITRINIIGGGSQNDLLNRLTEQACGIPVIAGPVEATGIGNIMVQMKSCNI